MFFLIFYLGFNAETVNIECQDKEDEEDVKGVEIGLFVDV